MYNKKENMTKVIRLKEQDIHRMVKRVVNEQQEIDPYANKRYDADTDEWVSGEEIKDNEITGLVSDLKYIMDDIINRIDTLEEYKRKEVADDVYSLDHKISVLWEKVKHLRPTNDGPDVEYGDEEDERRYDDRENYGIDDESRYDERNYKYGNNPDDD